MAYKSIAFIVPRSQTRIYCEGGTSTPASRTVHTLCFKSGRIRLTFVRFVRFLPIRHPGVDIVRLI